MKTWELTEEEKKTLERYNLYLAAIFGDDGISWSAYIYDYGSDVDWYDDSAVPARGAWERRDEIDNSTDAMKLLNSIAKSIINNTEYDQYMDCDDCDGSGYADIQYNPVDKIFKLNVSVNQTLSQEYYTDVTFEKMLEGYRGIMREPWYIKLVDQSFIDELISENDGKTLFDFEYNGGGDSGQIESSLPYDSKILNIAYEIIDLYHGGWENDEGGDGKITIDLENKKVIMTHTQYYGESFDVEMGEVKLV